MADCSFRSISGISTRPGLLLVYPLRAQYILYIFALFFCFFTFWFILCFLLLSIPHDACLHILKLPCFAFILRNVVYLPSLHGVLGLLIKKFYSVQLIYLDI